MNFYKLKRKLTSYIKFKKLAKSIKLVALSQLSNFKKKISTRGILLNSVMLFYNKNILYDSIIMSSFLFNLKKATLCNRMLNNNILNTNVNLNGTDLYTELKKLAYMLNEVNNDYLLYNLRKIDINNSFYKAHSNDKLNYLFELNKTLNYIKHNLNDLNNLERTHLLHKSIIESGLDKVLNRFMSNMLEERSHIEEFTNNYFVEKHTGLEYCSLNPPTDNNCNNELKDQLVQQSKHTCIATKINNNMVVKTWTTSDYISIFSEYNGTRVVHKLNNIFICDLPSGITQKVSPINTIYSSEMYNVVNSNKLVACLPPEKHSYTALDIDMFKQNIFILHDICCKFIANYNSFFNIARYLTGGLMDEKLPAIEYNLHQDNKESMKQYHVKTTPTHLDKEELFNNSASKLSKKVDITDVVVNTSEKVINYVIN